MLFIVCLVAAFLHSHAVFTLCLFVLSLSTGDTFLAQMFVPTYMGVGKTASFLEEDSYTH